MKCLRLFVLVLCLVLAKSAFALTLTVKVSGLEADELQNVLLFLDIYKEKDNPKLLPSRLHRLHALAPKQIKRALEPFGYYRAEVSAQLTQSVDAWEASYRVVPGPALPISRLDIQVTGQGRDDPRFQALQQKLPNELGQTLNHPRYEEAKHALQRLAASRGYLDAAFVKSRISVDTKAYTATIELHFETGKRYAFGSVKFTQGSDAMDEAFLARYITFKQGDSYSNRTLLALRAALTDSDYFSQVEIRPLRDQTIDNEVPIEIALVSRKRGRYRIGLGFGTDTGPRVSFGHTRRLNRRGHKLDLNMKLSERLNSATLQYKIPLQNPVTEQLAFAGSVIDEKTDSRDSQTFKLGMNHTIARGAWQETKSLTFERENFSVANESETSNLLFPGIGWTRTDTDDRLFPSHGSRVSVNLLGSVNALGSDVSFLQARLAGKWVQRVSDAGRVILRGEVGTTLVDTAEDLPASKRFYVGGDQSIRGYGFEELGPTGASGDVVGGKHLLVGSAEYEHRLFGKWGAAVFYDVGNAFNAIDEDFNHGAGIGLRWNSPVGPVRIDLAVALSKPGNPLRLHFVIGPDL